MSRNRTKPESGWCEPSRLARGPNGRALCRWCSAEVSKGRRTFCSDACVHEWKLRTNPGYLRRCTFTRDRGVCAACGLDTEALLGELKKLRIQDWCTHEQVDPKRYSAWSRPYVHPFGGEMARRNYPMMVERAIELGLEPSRWDLTRSLWEADHIVPVSEGGGECGLDNIRTLCHRCHRVETARLAERARVRRIIEHAGDLRAAVDWVMLQSETTR